MFAEIGWRRFMEDAFIAEDELEKNNACSLFAIFDGHAGKKLSSFRCRHGYLCSQALLLRASETS